LQGAPPTGQESKLKLESSSGITTEVERTVSGDLKPADQQQASLLAAHLLRDIREVQLAIDNGDLGAAETRLKKAGELVAIVQKILPVAKVAVVVKDREGTVLYQDEHVSQPHFIPISQNVMVVDLLRPLVAEKAKASKKPTPAEANGFQLQDSEVVATQIAVDVNFVSRRIKEAQRLLKADQDKASDALSAAIEEGVAISMAEFAEPLVEVRDALWYAHRAVASRNYAEARANLATAREQLAALNDRLTPGEQKEAAALANDIQQIENGLKNPTADQHGKALTGLEQAGNRLMRWFAAKGNNTTPPANQGTAAKAEALKQK
jgi:hypothetical protein